MANNKEEGKADKPLNSYGKFTGIAFQMVAIIGVFSFAGYKIDMAANHGVKWVTAVLALIGVFLSLYIVIKSINSK
jgi:F0F1-type ATP synthase assembly protein I